MNRKTFIIMLMPLLMLAAACSSDKDEMKLQSLVFIPEQNNGFIRIDGTSPITMRYRVVPKQFTTILANDKSQLSFENKSFSTSPSLTINQATADEESGVLTLTVTPSEGFVHDGNYAFSLVYTADQTGFASAYTPVFVVIHPTSVTITFIGVQDSSQPLVVDNTYQLQANFTPTYTTETLVNWSSSNTDVATIDANGVLSILDNGTTTITVASVDNPQVSYSTTITATGGGIPLNPEGGGQNGAE